MKAKNQFRIEIKDGVLFIKDGMIVNYLSHEEYNNNIVLKDLCEKIDDEKIDDVKPPITKNTKEEIDTEKFKDILNVDNCKQITKINRPESLKEKILELINSPPKNSRTLGECKLVYDKKEVVKILTEIIYEIIEE